MKNLCLIFIFFFSLFSFAQRKKAKVVGVKDGDTIVVLDSLNKQITIRLAEVDCPEDGQPFSKNAKQFTSDKVFGKIISYEVTDIDRYGRTIAKVFYDDFYLSRELIRNGLGWWYYHYSTDKSLGQLQKEAQQQKKGLFSDKHHIAPWAYRQAKRSKVYDNL